MHLTRWPFYNKIVAGICLVLTLLLSVTKLAVTDISYNNLQYKSREVLRKFFVQHRVIPDVIAVAPSYVLEVQFTRKFIVNLGNKLDPASTQLRPKFILWPAFNESLYSLCFVDADVPSRQNRKYKQRIHWAVINIPGRNLYAGETVVEYLGPMTRKYSGLHRYVFAVFKQYGHIDYMDPRLNAVEDRISKHRIFFSMRNFAEKYKLRDPIAVNFFLTGWPLTQEKDTVFTFNPNATDDYSAVDGDNIHSEDSPASHTDSSQITGDHSSHDGTTEINSETTTQHPD